MIDAAADRPADAAGVTRRIAIRRLGRVEYAEALRLQDQLVAERRSGAIGDTLLLLEHPPVITLGARNRRGETHIVATRDELARQGITVYDTGRGGDVTYHGPGQLIGYPILDLNPDRRDVHRYVRDLEDVMIRTVAEFGVAARRLEGKTGIWVGEPGREEKLGAIGVRISRWITSHGFALNVGTNLQHFQLIVPCGIADRGVISLDRLVGRTIPMAQVVEATVASMSAVFSRPVQGW